MRTSHPLVENRSDYDDADSEEVTEDEDNGPDLKESVDTYLKQKGIKEDEVDIGTLMEGLKVMTNQDPEPIPGNLYRAWAFSMSFGNTGAAQVAAWCIVITQTLAPLAIGYYAYNQINWAEIKWFDTSDWTYDGDVGVSKITTKILAVFLTLCFLADLFLSSAGPVKEWVKLRMIMDECFGESLRPPSFLFYMYLGSIMNSITALVVVFDTTLFMAVAIADNSPADVVLNILGFKFLLSMDDIGGDLDFLGGLAWDGDAMATLYNKYTCASALEQDAIPKRKKEEFKNYILVWTKYLLGIFPLLIPLLLALCSNITLVEEESGGDAQGISANMTALQSQVMQLESQMALNIATINQLAAVLAQNNLTTIVR